MKTAVALTSIRTFHQIGHVIASQEKRVLACMEIGRTYTRRELGVIVGIENTAAVRSVNGLVKSGELVEVGEKQCSHSERVVGAVMLPHSQMALFS